MVLPHEHGSNVDMLDVWRKTFLDGLRLNEERMLLRELLASLPLRFSLLSPKARRRARVRKELILRVDESGML